MKNKYKHIGKILVTTICIGIISVQPVLAVSGGAIDGKMYDQFIEDSGCLTDDPCFYVKIHRGIFGTSVSYYGEAYTLGEARKMFLYPKACKLRRGYKNYPDTDEEWLVDGYDYTPPTITREEAAFFDNALNSGVLTIDYLGQGFAAGTIDKRKVAAWLEEKDIKELFVIQEKLFHRGDDDLYRLQLLDRYCNPIIVRYDDMSNGTCKWETIYKMAYPPPVIEDPEPYYGKVKKS